MVLLAALTLSGTAAAATLYVTKTGSDGGSCSIASPCLTIGFALAQASPSGDNIVFLDVTPQVYAENLIIDKSITITGNGSDVLSPNRTTIRSANGGSDRDVITIRAPNVVIEDVILFVNLVNTRQAIRAESSAAPLFSSDGLIVRDCLIRVESTGAPQPAYEERNAVMLNPTSGPHFSASFTNVRIDGTPLPAPGVFFRAGIDARNAAVSVTGSDIATINHDLKLTQVSGAILIDNNTFRFGGVQIGSYNASAGVNTSVTVQNNRFHPAQSPAFPGLRLIENTQVNAGSAFVPTVVSGNTFGGTNPGAAIPELGLQYGVFGQNYPNVTITGNVFNPLSSATAFSHIIVSNKTIYTNNPPDAPLPLDQILITSNTFNGQGTSTAGFGVEFLNHNSVGASFGQITVGGAGALANTFDIQLDRYLSLSEQVGPTPTNPYYYSAPAIIPATQMAPFAGDILAPNNIFAGTASSTMTVAQLVEVNQQTQDRRDHTALALMPADIGVIVFGDENAAYSLTDPRSPAFFLPRDTGMAFEDCDGNQNATGCYDLSLTNPAGTAVAEHAELEFRLTRAVANIAAGNAEIEYQATAATGGTIGSYVSIPLTLDGTELVGRIPNPQTAITLPPIAIENAAAELLDGLRARFTRGGSYSVTTRLLGKETDDLYGVLDTDQIEVADLQLSLNGPARAQDVNLAANDAIYALELDNTDGGQTENLDVIVRVFGQDELGCASLSLAVSGDNGPFAPTCSAIMAGVESGSVEFRYGPFALGAGTISNHAIAADFAGSDIFRFEVEVLSSIGGTGNAYGEAGTGPTVAGEDQAGRNTFRIRSLAATGFGVDPNQDNDFTRINLAVRQLQDGDTLELEGTFDWSGGTANLSWMAGSDGVVDGIDPVNIFLGDDYALTVPANLDDVVITSTAACSNGSPSTCGARILGPLMDDPTVPLERFLSFDQGVYTGLTIANLRIEGFDIGLYLRNTAMPGAFDGLLIDNNEFVVPADADDMFETYPPGFEGFVFNRAIYAGIGNGSVSGNRIWLAGGGIAGSYSTGPFGRYYSGSRSSGIELQVSTSASFNGFSISGNTITPMGTGGELVGIWDNAADCGSVITIDGNRFHGSGASPNGQFGLRLSSFGTEVTGNILTGTEAGIHWSEEVANFCAGVTAVQVTSNVLLDNDHGVLIEDTSDVTIGMTVYPADAVAAVLASNRIVDNGVGFEDRQDGTAISTAENNWWGCNAGPDADPACDPVVDADNGIQDLVSWLQLRLIAAPTTIDIADSSALTIDMVRRSDNTIDTAFPPLPAAADPMLFVDGKTRSLVAGTGNVDVSPNPTPNELQFVAGSDAATYTPNQQGVDAVTATVDNQAVSVDILVTTNLPPPTVLVQSFAVTGGTPDAIDNDYTRINRAVQLLIGGTTLVLEGAFDWTEANARASFALGSNGSTGDEDDWSILLPGGIGLNDITIRADLPLGASISAGGDTVNTGPEQTSFLRTSTSTVGSFVDAPSDETFHGLRIENLVFDGFDRAIWLRLPANGFGYSNSSFTGNRFVIHPDTDGMSQFALLTGYGTSQQVSSNRFEIDITGSAAPSSYTGFATGSGGASGQYDGLVVSDNEVEITGVPAAPMPPRVVGLWENGEDSDSAISILDNRLTGSGGTSLSSNQVGIIASTHSNGPRLALVRGNQVSGFGVGLTTQYAAFAHYVLAPDAQIIEGNDFSANGRGVVLRSGGVTSVAPQSDLRINRIVGNAEGVVRNPAGGGEVDAIVTAENNWWGCNDGPGAQPIGCAAVANPAINVIVTDWLRLHLRSDGLAVSGVNESFDAVLSVLPTPLSPDLSGYPDANIAFDTSLGSVTSPVALNAGVAANTLVTSAPEDQGGALVAASYDSQTVTTLIRVAPDDCAMPAAGCLFLIVSTSASGDTPDALDNDYTRINNAVQASASGDQIQLLGDFDWTTGDARVSWEAGSNGVVDNSTLFEGYADDYTVRLPAGLSNVRVFASSLGDASILGDQGTATQDVTSFISAYADIGAALRTNTDWSIENLELTGFDVSIGLVAPIGGNDDFDRTRLLGNRINIARDLGDFYANYGIYAGYGSDQVIDGNELLIDLAGATAAQNPRHVAIQVGDSCNGDCFDGLQVSANRIETGGVPLDGTPLVIGIWENAGDVNSSLTISDNVILGSGDLGGGVENNNQFGIAATTQSNGARQSQVAGNAVSGMQFGLRSQMPQFGHFVGSDSPLLISGNTLVDNGTAVHLQAAYDGTGSNFSRYTLRFNRIAGNVIGLFAERADDLPLPGDPGYGGDEQPSRIDVDNNWWGCNEGPASIGQGCDPVVVEAGPDAAQVVQDTWLLLSIASDTPVVAHGGLALIDADVNTNSSLTNLSAQTVFPACTAIAFGSSTSATFDAAQRATGVAASCPNGLDAGNATGVANNVLRVILSDTLASATLDAETVSTLVRVEDVRLDADLPGAAALGVTTQPFPVTISNGSPSAFNDLDVYFTIGFLGDDSSTALVPADLLLEYQCGPGWCPLTLANATPDNLQGQFALGTLNAGQTITVNVRATFELDGVFSIDAVLVDDMAGVTYAEDGGDVSVAGSDDVVLMLVSGSPQTAPVNTAYAVPAVVRVVDEVGNPLSGVNVDFVPAGMNADVGFANASALSAHDGTASTGVITANAVAGPVVTASAQLDGSVCAGATCSIDFDFSNTAATPDAVTLAFPGTTTATVLTAFDAAFCATVVDADNNAVAGVSVAFVSLGAGAGAGFAPVTVLTDASGLACSMATANATAGSYNVQAQVAAASGSNLVGLTNVAAAASQLHFVSGSPQSAPLNTAFGAALVVRTTDANGNPVAGEAVAFVATPAGNGASANFAAAAATNANGLTSVSPSANGWPGTYVVSAGTGYGDVDFGLTNTVAAPTQLALLSDVATAPVGAPGGAYNLTATVTDGANPVPGVSVTFVVEPAGNGAGALPSNVVDVTDINGVATAGFAANSIAGTFVIRAVVSGVMADADDQVSLTNTPDAAASITLDASPDSAIAGTAGAYSLTATVLDQFGNAVADGTVVTFDSPDSGAGISPVDPTDTTVGGIAMVLADANATTGTFLVTATAGAVNSNAVMLENTVDGNAISLTLQGDAVGSVTLSGGPVYSFSSATTNNSGPAPAENVIAHLLISRVGGADAVDLEVEYRAALDEGGCVSANPDPGFWCPLPVTDANSDGVLEASFGPATGFPLVDGETSMFRTVYHTGGRYTVAVSIDGVSSGNTYAADDRDTDVAQLLLGQTPVASAGSVGVALPSSNNLRNAGTAGLDNGLFPAPHPASDMPNDVNALVRFVITGDSTLDPSDVLVEYYSPSECPAQADGWCDIATEDATPGDMQLEGGFGPQATGFPVAAGYDVTTLFRSTFLVPGTYAIATRVIGVDTAGTLTGVVYADAAQSVSIGTGSAATIHLISGDAQSTVVNTAFASALVVEARDVGGNPVPDAAVSFNAIAAANGASSDSTSLMTGGDGRASFTPTANTIAGSYIVRAGLGNGQSVDFSLSNTPAAAAALEYVSGDGQSVTVGNAFADLQVRVVDGFGNAVITPAQVTFTAPASGASASVSSPVMSGVGGIASSAATANGTAGTYVVTASLGASTVSFDLTNAAGSIGISDIRWDDTGTTTTEYTGLAKTATFTTVPAGVTCSVAYNGSSAAPTDAGTYLVQVSCMDADAGLFGSANANLVITRADSGITLTGGTFTFDGQPKPANVDNPNAAAFSLSYAGTTAAGASFGPTAVPPLNAGNYTATLTVTDANYQEPVALTAPIDIDPASVTVSFGNLSHVYDGNAKAASVSTTPMGVAGISLSYSQGPTPVPAPTDAGSYTVTAALSNFDYTLGGDIDDTLVIAQATAQVTLSNLTQVFDGSPRMVDVTTVPAMLATDVTYDGNAMPPSAVGSYAVVATVNELNYQGSASGTLTILSAPLSSFVVEGDDTLAGVAGALLDPVHVVRALDSNGQGVAGVTVLFALGGGGGSATGLSAVTDAGGRASVASWTLGADAGSNSMTASVPNSGLADLALTAIGAENADVAIGKSSATVQAQPGDAITYSLVVSHVGGPSNAAAVDILDMLPDGLDVATATWLCAGADGASCDQPSGTGDVQVGAAIPVGASVTVTLTATVESDASFGPLVNTAMAELTSSTDLDESDNEDSHSVTIVPLTDAIFSDGFEDDVTPELVASDIKRLGLDSAASLRAPLPVTGQRPELAFTILGSDGGALVLVDVFSAGSDAWFRLRHRDPRRIERFSQWKALADGGLDVAWALDFEGVMLRVGSASGENEVRMQLAPGRALPWRVLTGAMRID